MEDDIGVRGCAPHQRRIVLKGGSLNLATRRLPNRPYRFLVDIVTTLIDIKWRWTLLIFSSSFLFSWLFFALIWWSLLLMHGDLEWYMLTDVMNTSSTAEIGTTSYVQQKSQQSTPCIHNVNSFIDVVLFSLETQQTIGYGSRYVSDECLNALLLLCMQCVVGLIVQSLMVSVVFAKLARPTRRANTLMFSRRAVICRRDGRLCLMFRVANLQTSSLVAARVRAFIVQRCVSLEHEVLPCHLRELAVGADRSGGGGGGQMLLFIWPLTIVHTIDAASPLYSLSAAGLRRSCFELIVVIEGVAESTGVTTQARSSYLPTEIVWGHQFMPTVHFSRATGQYAVDLAQFDRTVPVVTPLLSAAQLEMTRK